MANSEIRDAGQEGTKEHNVNPATDRCVLCGANAFRRSKMQGCLKWNSEVPVSAPVPERTNEASHQSVCPTQNCDCDDCQYCCDGAPCICDERIKKEEALAAPVPEPEPSAAELGQVFVKEMADNIRVNVGEDKARRAEPPARKDEAEFTEKLAKSYGAEMGELSNWCSLCGDFTVVPGNSMCAYCINHLKSARKDEPGTLTRFACLCGEQFQVEGKVIGRLLWQSPLAPSAKVPPVAPQASPEAPAKEDEVKFERDRKSLLFVVEGFVRRGEELRLGKVGTKSLCDLLAQARLGLSRRAE